MAGLVTDDKRGTRKQELYKLEITDNGFGLYAPNGYVVLNFDATTERLIVTERRGRLEHCEDTQDGYTQHLFTRLDTT